MKLFVKRGLEEGKRNEFIASMAVLYLFWIIISLPPHLFTAKGLAALFQSALVGMPLAYLVTRIISRPVFTDAEIKAHRLPTIMRVLGYSFYLVAQILLAGVDVAKRVMRPKLDISPGVIKFRTSLSDELQIAMNANSITLTPGTITIDAERDEHGSTFRVHCMSKQGLEEIRANKGFVGKINDIYKQENS